MQRNFASFIKFGKKEHLEKLYHYGELFCKPIEYFSKIDEKDLRGDKYDGITYIKQITNLKVMHQGNLIASSSSGRLYGRNPKDKGNIFCLFGLASESLNLDSKTIQKLVINLDGVSFGDAALWIYDPGEFVKRVKKALTKQDYKFDFYPVTYLDYNTYEGELSPFTKSHIYACQSEVRFWIANDQNVDLKINIGDISDISAILSIDMFDKLEYEAL